MPKRRATARSAGDQATPKGSGILSAAGKIRGLPQSPAPAAFVYDPAGIDLFREGPAMRIHNLYTDASGQSHFRDIEVEWTEQRRGSKMSKRLPANGIIFRETQAEHDIDWHPAPRRQYIINLDAGVKITASDGEARVIGVGEVILVEDTTGKGHLSQHVEGKIRHSIFVPVE
jgi:hypothetical protein